MSKKEFKSGLDFLLQGSTPQEEKAKIEKTTITISDQTEIEVRATFIIKESQLTELKSLAFWQRKQIKQVLCEAITQFMSNTPREEYNIAMQEYKKSKHTLKDRGYF